MLTVSCVLQLPGGSAYDVHRLLAGDGWAYEYAADGKAIVFGMCRHFADD